MVDWGGETSAMIHGFGGIFRVFGKEEGVAAMGVSKRGGGGYITARSKNKIGAGSSAVDTYID